MAQPQVLQAQGEVLGISSSTSQGADWPLPLLGALSLSVLLLQPVYEEESNTSCQSQLTHF